MAVPLDASAVDDPLADLHPLVDPFRCPNCLERGDSCDFHTGLALGLDLGEALFTTDPKEIAA